MGSDNSPVHEVLTKTDDGNVETEDAANDELAREHARIDDPVEPPARNAPKNNVIPGNRDSISGEEQMPVALLPVDSKSILSRLFDPDRKQKPQLWTHIKLVAPGPADQPPPGHIKWRSKDAIAAYCLKCKKQFTYTRGTSKTISRHMQAYHGLILNETGTTPTKGTAGVKRQADDLSSPPPLKKRKPDFDQAAQVALLSWIAGSFRPWSMVEDEGLQEFAQSLSDSFVIPTTEEMIRLAMDTQEKVKLEVRQQLKGCEDYSVSCQEFEHRGKTYCSVQVTFCTESFERKTMSLRVASGNCNMESVHDFLREYGLPVSQVTNVTLKNVPESVNLEIGGEEACVLHKMDVLVSDALSSQEPVTKLLMDLQHHVHAASGWIRSGTIVARMPVPIYRGSVKDVYSMLQTFNSNHDSPENASSWSPDESQTTMLKSLTAILKPFYDATATLSGEKHPTIGLTIPVFRRIRDVLEKLNIAEVVESSKEEKSLKAMSDFHKSLVASFSKSFEHLLDADPPAMWTIPLDPRLIHMGGLSDQEKESVTKVLISRVKERKLATKDGDSSKHVADTGADGEVAKKDEKGEESTMGGIFWGDDMEDSEKASTTAEAASAYARSNVDRYFTTVKSQRRIEDPLTWWNSNQKSFPELSQMARVWLGASAIGPETDGRQDYPEENVEILSFLHDNRHLI